MTNMNSEDMNEEIAVNYSAEIFNNWDEFNMNEDLLRGIYAYGFEKPSPIQQRAIKPLIDKKDIVAQAQSGTGKTATFAIGALANVDISNRSTQVLVLSPTKELTIQTADVFKGLSQFMTGIKIQLAYGGSVIEDLSSTRVSFDIDCDW